MREMFPEPQLPPHSFTDLKKLLKYSHLLFYSFTDHNHVFGCDLVWKGVCNVRVSQPFAEPRHKFYIRGITRHTTKQKCHQVYMMQYNENGLTIYLLATIIWILRYWCVSCSATVCGCFDLARSSANRKLALTAFSLVLVVFPKKRCLFLSFGRAVEHNRPCCCFEATAVLSGDGSLEYSSCEIQRPCVTSTHLKDTSFINRNDTLNPPPPPNPSPDNTIWLIEEICSHLLSVWKQECRPTRKGWLEACSNTCFSVWTQSMSWRGNTEKSTENTWEIILTSHPRTHSSWISTVLDWLSSTEEARLCARWAAGGEKGWAGW